MAIVRYRQIAPDPNDTDDDRGYIASIVPYMLLSFTALMMRLASRRIKRSHFPVSDYLTIAGFLCAWVVSSTPIAEGGLGLGLHVDRVSPTSIREILVTEFIGELSYCVGFTLIKLSIIALYR
ncbi:hypothetical protein GGR58DRAFT_275826 [Xylaria digitata]|nr:hypothetical protein GGR58DRAFT_275826 [Xylaria digitata]